MRGREAGWPGGEGAAPLGRLGERWDGPAGLGDGALALVTAEDVRSILADCAPSTLRALLRQVGLRDAKKVNGSIAEMVLRNLRNGDSRRRDVMARIVAGGYLHGFGNADGLSAADCAALLHVETAHEVLGRAPVLRAQLRWDCPASIARWCLALVIEADRPLAPIALGLLLECSPAADTQREPMRKVWDTLRADDPALPSDPISLERLRELARRPADATTDPGDEGGDGMTASRSGIADLAAVIDELQAGCVKTAEAAERVAAAARAGERPEQDDADEICALIAAFDTAMALLPAEGGPLNLAALSDALEVARVAEQSEDRLRALAHVEGPEMLAEQLNEVREAARSGSPRQLVVLAELIEAAAQPDGFTRAPGLAEEARERLPERWQSLIYPALMGRLTIGARPQQTDREEEAPPSPVPQDSPRDVDEDVDEQEHDDPEDDLADLDGLIAATFPSEPPAQCPSSTSDAEPDVPDALPASQHEPASEEDKEEHQEDATSAPVQHTKASQAQSSMSADLIAAEVAVLRAGRFGLAARLRVVGERPKAEERARRCAALAAEMATFAGALSAEFAEAARDLTAKALADDPAGGVLAWAAAIRAGLVYPTSESTRLLEELTIVMSEHPELETCGHAFIRAARNGAYLGPGLAGRIRGSAEAAEFRRNAVTEAKRLLEQEPHRTIKYQLATEVWKKLIRDGEVGTLLAAAARDDAAQVDAVAARITVLRTGDAINRLIGEATGRITARGKNKNKKIIAGAHGALVKKVENSLETIGCWAAAVKETGAGGDIESQDWRLGPLRQLQDMVGDRGDAIDAALARLAATSDDVLAAAGEAARGLVGQALDLLGGASLEAPEPPVSHVLNRHLLLIPGASLDPSTFEPCAPLTAADLVQVALSEDEDWNEAFERRAERLDHEGTRGIVAVLERTDPETARALHLRREGLVEAARASRDGWVEEIRDRIAEWLRAGVLTEDRARRAEEKLRALAGGRFDFDRIRGELDDLEAALYADRRSEIERERKRLTERKARDPRITDSDAGRVADRIEEGDLTTAREFMAQLEAGNPLPEATGEADHLARFYPAFPSAFAGIAVRAGNRARRQETDEVLTDLKDALRGGRDVTDPDLAALLSGAGIAIPSLRNARREEASEGLRLWRACGQRSTTDATQRTAITAILKMVGLEGDQRGEEKGQHRTWIDLEGVRWVGENPLPAFGSRMSPSGDRLRLLLVWRRPGPQQLIELLKGQPEDQTILVFYFGVLSAEERQQLAVAARRRPAPVTAVLDDAAIGYLACMPEADWSVAVTLTAPFTATNPYAPVGDVPDEMFYGRDRQLREVTGRTRCSFVYGGRQLGKSALLRKAERDIRRRNDISHVVILENIQTVGKVAQPESLWPKLADKLAGAGVIPTGVVQRDRVRDAVREWARADPGRQVLVLLDEADQFLNQDAEDGLFENVTVLRDLMDETGDRFKVVFAGLHQTVRFQSLPNQPLAHLGTPVAVGPLEPQNAFDLLVRPLAALGFRFPETLAARVISEANNAPALVQLFAEGLLTRLRRNPTAPPYEITSEDVEAVWRDKSLVRGFRDRFEWTLNLDKRYKVIAYTVALHALVAGADETLSVSDLWDQCAKAWPAGFEGCTSDGFRGLLDECVNLGVLGLSADRYRLRTPHILNLLGGIDDVEKVLDNAGEFELPDSFDGHSYRGTYGDGPERSPLNSVQLARMSRPHNVVHVVAGSPALHLHRVHRTLEAVKSERTDLEVLRVSRDGMNFDGACARANRHTGHSVMVVEVAGTRTLEHFTEKLAEAREAVSRCRRGTLAVVLVAPPSLAPAWVRAAGVDGVELVELRRFDRPAVRQWMSEDSQQGFPDEAGQDALLARTGGWPTLIGQVVRWIDEHGGDRDRALDHTSEQLRDAPGDFVRSTGVMADEALAAAWKVLVREDAPDTVDDLTTLLGLHGDDDEPALAPPALARLGYASASDPIEVLRVLGALIPADGRLACEPVLAEATRRMEAS